MKKLAVLGDFLEPHHHAQIDSTAARCGFAVDYYPDGHVPAELTGQYEVLYGMPDRAAFRTFTGLKWFCGNFAGVDAYLDDALYPSPDVVLSNSSGAYGVTIAEHLIMVTLMLLRHASAYVLEAAAHRWGPVLPMRSIMGSTITVVGTGDIGTEFARRAKAMGAKSIRGVRRTMKPADPAFDSVHTHDQLESLLPDTDLLVLALPSTPDTIGFLSRRRIALLPKTAFVINVPRQRHRPARAGGRPERRAVGRRGTGRVRAGAHPRRRPHLGRQEPPADASRLRPVEPGLYAG